MLRTRLNEKGVMLFIVLATLLIVAIIANGVLGFILSHSQQTYHQIRRIQAYYAALAGMNLAIEKLRTGTGGCPPAAGCSFKLCHSGCIGAYDNNDWDIPYPVEISITAPDPTTGIRTINCTVNYTYTP